MNDQTPHHLGQPPAGRMTVDEYLPWAIARGGRWELIDGRPVKMPSETLDHIDVKFCVCLIFKELIDASGRELHALSDGATVRIDPNNANEPDALVYAGPKRPGRSLEVPDPLIVVEVVSPTSSNRDKTRKRRDYFSLPSVAHYLIVDPEQRNALHFTRSTWQGDGLILTEADIADLSPTGLQLPIRRCFAWR